MASSEKLQERSHVKPYSLTTLEKVNIHKVFSCPVVDHKVVVNEKAKQSSFALRLDREALSLVHE
jgi:hypothetical protein